MKKSNLQKMKPFRCSILVVLLGLFAFLPRCKIADETIVFIENDKIQLGFDKNTGSFLVFRDLVNNHEFIDKGLVRSLPWEITYQKFSDIHKIDQTYSFGFSYSTPDNSTLILVWENFKGINNDDFKITAEIKLDNNKPFSYWDILIEGTRRKLITEVIFPKIEELKDLGEYFYGYNVHLLFTADGIPVEYTFLPSRSHDSNALKQMPFVLPPGNKIYADAGYINYVIEDMLKNAEGIYLLAQRTSRLKRQHEPYVDYIITTMRKRIETAFSEIANFFPKKIHAVTEYGFLLKIVTFIFGYAISRTVI